MVSVEIRVSLEALEKFLEGNKVFLSEEQKTFLRAFIANQRGTEKRAKEMEAMLSEACKLLGCFAEDETYANEQQNKSRDAQWN